MYSVGDPVSVLASIRVADPDGSRLMFLEARGRAGPPGFFICRSTRILCLPILFRPGTFMS